jgi:DHA2 family multidrug resistance protein
MTATHEAPKHRGIITITVMVASVLQMVDNTIANVALPRMQGSLSATQDQIAWVLTSYVVAAAIMTPLTGWLADRFGRKPVFLFSVIGFTIASALCGMAFSLDQVVFFRLLQGVCGAALVPLSQAVLLDIYPPSQHGRAMSIWGLGTVVGPMIGPLLGGWLTDSYSWRWVFYINAPIGVLALLGILAYMPDTRHARKPFDFFGFTALSLFVGMLQLVLDRGPTVDWFNSTEIKVEVLVGALGLYLFIVHTWTAQHPFVRFSLFRDRNYLSGNCLIFVIGLTMMSTMSLLAPFLQQLMHYSVLQAGFLISPRSLGSVAGMLLVGQLIARVDTRLIVGTGLCLTAVSMWLMMGFSLQMDMRPVLWSGVFQGIGMGIAWVPVIAMTFATLAPDMRNEATALLGLVRNLGTSVGISVVQGLLIRNMQVAHASLSAHITPYTRGVPGVAGVGGAKLAAMLNEQVTTQAALLAYIDDFKFMLILTFVAIVFLLFVRDPGRQVPADTQIVVE